MALADAVYQQLAAGNATMPPSTGAASTTPTPGTKP
jgi:hypothetical protein